MKSLPYRLALITGASSGIGAACAEKLASEGINLVLVARRQDKLDGLARDLSQRFGVQIHTLVLDVRDRGTVLSGIQSLPLAFQSIDILVNNAGLAAGLDKIQDADIEDWEQMLDTNVKGLLYVIKAVLPQMLSRGQGHIINMGSIASRQTYPGGAVYCASKVAVNRINEGLRMDILGSGVRVTAIDPGMVETEFSIVRFKGDEGRANKVYQGMTPLRPEDIAEAMWYAVNCPAHVNIAEMLIYPTDQASASLVHRREEN